MSYCNGQPLLVEARGAFLDKANSTCRALDEESGHELKKLTQPIANRVEAAIASGRSGSDQQRELAAVASEWTASYEWLARLQLWSPLIDALDGVLKSGEEKARHMAYRGIIAGAVDKALKAAAVSARKQAKLAATNDEGAKAAGALHRPTTRVHAALSSAARGMHAITQGLMQTRTDQAKAQAAAAVVADALQLPSEAELLTALDPGRRGAAPRSRFGTSTGFGS